MGQKRADTPSIKRILNVLLPIIALMPTGLLLNTEAIFILNSGIDVPIPTITTPVNQFEILKIRAIEIAPSTKIFAPFIKI